MDGEETTAEEGEAEAEGEAEQDAKLPALATHDLRHSHDRHQYISHAYAHDGHPASPLTADIQARGINPFFSSASGSSERSSSERPQDGGGDRTSSTALPLSTAAATSYSGRYEATTGAGLVMQDTVWFEAAKNGDLAKIDALIDAKAQVNRRKHFIGWTALLFATDGGHLDVVRRLAGARADTAGDGALHFAARDGHLEIVKCLLETKAKVDDRRGFDGKPPLLEAAYAGRLRTTQCLIDASADISSTSNSGLTALHCAAQSDGIEVVKYLLEMKAAISSKNVNGQTPLRCAVDNCSMTVAQHLAETKADIASIDNKGNTCLHSASIHGNVEVMQWIIEAKAQIDKRNLAGQTALHICCTWGNLDALAYLTRLNAQLELQDHKGWTPLHYAAAYGHPKLVKQLIDVGAEIESTTDDGATADQLAAFKTQLNQRNPHARLAYENVSKHLADERGHRALTRVLHRDVPQLSMLFQEILTSAGPRPDFAGARPTLSGNYI